MSAVWILVARRCTDRLTLCVPALPQDGWGHPPTAVVVLVTSPKVQ